MRNFGSAISGACFETGLRPSSARRSGWLEGVYPLHRRRDAPHAPNLVMLRSDAQQRVAKHARSCRFVRKT